jgi:hypothetical protein
MTASVTGSVQLLSAPGGTVLATIGAAPATAPGYDLLGAGESSVQRRRDVVTSPWVAGEQEVASVEGALTYDLVIHAVGGDWATTQGLVTTIRDAVTRTSWALRETLGGHVEDYLCRAAVSFEARRERDLMINGRCAITVTIPVERA